MTPEPATATDEILADCMRRIDAGESIDLDAWCSRHPDAADDLRLYFAAAADIERLAGPAVATDNLHGAETIVPDAVPGRDTATNAAVESRGAGGRSRSESTGVGERFGRYRIVKTLGEGAMGAVYLAEDTLLGRDVALKLPKFGGDDPEMIERFQTEARTAATLRHPGICPVYDVGEINGKQFITMAYIPGRPLSDYAKSRTAQPVRQVVKVVRKLCLALHVAHEAGVVHRDVKPANVMIDKSGEPVVMDFGLARQTTSTDVRLTRSGAVMGTPAFMSPEQVEGRIDDVGPKSDQFSLGGVLYEMLTGHLPFEGQSVAVVMSRILNDTARPPSALRPEVDSGLDAICLRMLSRGMEDRYDSLKVVADELIDWLRRDKQGSTDGELADPRETSPFVHAAPPTDEGFFDAPLVSSLDLEPPPVEPAAETAANAAAPTIVVDESDRAPHRTTTRRRSRGKTPPPPWRWIAAGVGGSALLLLLGIVFLLPTPEGTLRVEVEEGAEVEVLVDGKKITLKDFKGQKDLSATEHRLSLLVNDVAVPFDAKTPTFTYDGRKVKVEMAGAELRGDLFKVARNGTTVLRIGFEPDVSPRPEPRPETEPESDRRTLWVHPSGEFAEIGKGVWEEISPNGSKFVFKEIARTDVYIELDPLNGSLALRYRLYDDRCDRGRKPNVVYATLFPDGGWVTPPSETESVRRPPADAVKFGDSYLKAFPDTLTWHQARRRCLELGGHLAIVDSKEENDEIVRLLGTTGVEQAWLGASDELVEGAWKWTDGRPLAYSNWALGQPNNESRTAHHLVVWSSRLDSRYEPGRWYDAPCYVTTFKTGFVCEWVSSVGPAPPPAPDTIRRLSERIIGLGGSVRHSGPDQKLVDRIEDLPPGELRIDAVTFRGKGQRVRNEDVGLLSELPDLATVHFGQTPVTDAGFTRLAELDGVRDLHFVKAALGDAGLAALVELPQLDLLELWHTDVTDDGLQALAKMPALTRLTLGVASHQKFGAAYVTDEGLAHLAGIEKLDKLWVYGPDFTDAAIEHLAKLETVREIKLGTPKISDAGLAELQRRLPTCTIVDARGTSGDENGFSGQSETRDEVDLLALIDADELQRLKADGTLETPDGRPVLRVRHSGDGKQVFAPIRYTPPGEYDLRLKVTRIGSGNGFGISTLADGGRNVNVYLDGYRGSGLYGIDGTTYLNREVHFPGKLFRTGFASEVVVRVRRTGVRIDVDGVTIVDWQGDLARLEPLPDTYPRISLGAYQATFDVTECLLVPWTSPVETRPTPDPKGWVDLFDGKSLDGWRVEGDAGWKVENGVLVGRGNRSRLVTVAEDFGDCEVRVQCRLALGGNSGVFVRTRFGQPTEGFEAQLSNQPVGAGAKTMTGGIYNRTVYQEQLVPDDEWLELRFRAEGRRLAVFVEDLQTADTSDLQYGSLRGAIALQSWGGQTVSFRKVEVRRLDE